MFERKEKGFFFFAAFLCFRRSLQNRMCRYLALFTVEEWAKWVTGATKNKTLSRNKKREKLNKPAV